VTFSSGGIPFRTGPQGRGEKNVVVCRGQTIPLPPSEFGHAWVVAATVGGDRSVVFRAGSREEIALVQDWAEPVGQWDSRLAGGTFVDDPGSIAPGYVKGAPVTWVGTHRHERRGADEPYVFTHFFRYCIPIPPGATSLTLPDDDRVRILALSVRRGTSVTVWSVHPPTEPSASLVHIVAPHRKLIGPTRVTLTSPNPGATIHYTLDGSEPTSASPTFTSPLVLERTTTMKARAVAEGLDDGFVATATFTKVEPHSAAVVPAAALSPGLACRLYEGDWRTLPDFSKLTPARSFTMATVGLSPDLPKEHFGLACEGYLSVPKHGLYTLAMRAEDGGELWIDGERVIVNDAIDFIARRTEVALKAGLHPVELRYFQRNFVSGLELRMDSPDSPLAAVAPERLHHRKPAP
jgi:hypothetical protein